jgi:hypothetical protein
LARQRLTDLQPTLPGGTASERGATATLKRAPATPPACETIREEITPYGPQASLI